jgi:DNA-binding GntR family transcriptional regulator
LGRETLLSEHQIPNSEFIISYPAYLSFSTRERIFGLNPNLPGNGEKYWNPKVLPSLEPAKSLVDRAYDVILDALCDGTLRPGERLTQEDIAARLKISRQPVTQALSLLKAQGFISSSGRRGMTVTPVEPQLFEAIYQFRSAVDPLAVRLATPHLTKKAIVQGKSIVERGRDLVASGDTRALLQSEMDFHSFIYDLSGNPIISSTMRLYWHHLRRAIAEVLRHEPTPISFWNEHAKILDVMIGGDAELAAELMRKHVVGGYEHIRSRAGVSLVEDGEQLLSSPILVRLERPPPDDDRPRARRTKR